MNSVTVVQSLPITFHRRPPLSLLVLTVLLSAVLSLLSAPGILMAEEQGDKQFTSVEERRLYSAIQQERATVLEEKKELELQKKELKSLEEGVDKKLAEIDKKLEELKILKKKIASLLEAKSVAEVERTQELAKIYEKMTPEKAAVAISSLKTQLAADLLSSMKVRSAARILDQISNRKATEISTAISTIQIE